MASPGGDCRAITAGLASQSGRRQAVAEISPRGARFSPGSFAGAGRRPQLAGAVADCRRSTCRFGRGKCAAFDPQTGKAFCMVEHTYPSDHGSHEKPCLDVVASRRVFSAADVYRRYGRLAHGWPVNLPDPQPHAPQEARLQAVRQSNRHRLDHDGEQLAYIDRITPLPAALKAQVSAYREVSAGLSAAQQNAVVFDLDDDQYNRIAASYGRHIWRYETGWSPTRPALNPAVNWSQIAADFAQATPAHQVIDHFLSADALHALRRFCRESTIWHVTKGNGYLGAYFQDGFNDPVLAAIAAQLRSSLPDLLGDYPVRMIWAYSYPQGGKGINPHADFARFNLNFWITEDDANLDPETGGLIIYRKAAPDHWDFKTYNTSSAQTIYDFLGADKQTFIRVPHRANRAVLFDSRLFHETDRFNFAPGFANRRINITMLFGKEP